MSFSINPNQRRGTDVPVTRTKKAEKSSAVTHMAEKVGQVVQLPVTKQSREVRLINDAKDLSKKIQSDWNNLTPSELAEKIIDLEGKVALLEGSTPAIEKIKKQAEHLHFQFVFPVALELSNAPEAEMPFSFARSINCVAKEILQTQSLEPLKELSDRQIDEIMKIARSGA